VRFDLEFTPRTRGAFGNLWIYNKDLFDSWRIEQMARHYEQLLVEVAQAWRNLCAIWGRECERSPADSRGSAPERKRG